MGLPEETKLPGVGIFGCGTWTYLLVKRLRFYGFSVEAIWANQSSVASYYAQKLNISFYTDKVDQLLLNKHVQVVFIFCSQQIIRAEIVCKAFRIGKHVICHSPPAISVSELHQLSYASSYYPSLVSSVFYPLRGLGSFEHLRKLIRDQKYIGELTSIDFRLSGSQLFDLGALLQLQDQPFSSFCCEQDLTCKDCKKVILKNETGIEHSTDPRIKHSLYHRRMCSGGISNSIAPHIVDIISYISGFRAKRISAMLRTFGNNGPIGTINNNNRTFLDSIRKIFVDDFCHFQLELQRHHQPPVIAQSRKPSTTETKNLKDAKQIDSKENITQDHQQHSNQHSSISNPNHCYFSTQYSNNAPVAIVSIDAHRNNTKLDCELIVSGTKGYICLHDNQIYGRQYEQNNNQAIEEEKPEILNFSKEGLSLSETKDLENFLKEQYCCCYNEKLNNEKTINCELSELKLNGQTVKSSHSLNKNDQESQQDKQTSNMPPQLTFLNNSLYKNWYRGYAFSCELLIQELNDLFQCYNAQKNIDSARESQNSKILNLGLNTNKNLPHPITDLSTKKLNNLFSLVAKDDQRMANFENALYVQTVIEAMHKSAENREWTRIDPYDAKFIQLLINTHRKLL